jgi:hypothetical protein
MRRVYSADGGTIWLEARAAQSGVLHSLGRS